MNITPASSRQSIKLSISSGSTFGRASLKACSGTTISFSGLVNSSQNLSMDSPPNSSRKVVMSS